jgi:hypothetical protein
LAAEGAGPRRHAERAGACHRRCLRVAVAVDRRERVPTAEFGRPRLALGEDALHGAQAWSQSTQTPDLVRQLDCCVLQGSSLGRDEDRGSHGGDDGDCPDQAHGRRR